LLKKREYKSEELKMIRGSIHRKKLKDGSNGNWYYSVRLNEKDKNGRRKQKTKGGFKRKKDAEIALKDFIKEYEERERLKLSDDTFEMFFSNWFHNYYSINVEDSTIDRFWDVSRKHLLD